MWLIGGWLGAGWGLVGGWLGVGWGSGGRLGVGCNTFGVKLLDDKLLRNRLESSHLKRSILKSSIRTHGLFSSLFLEEGININGIGIKDIFEVGCP